MEPNRSLESFEYTEAEKTEIIINNVLLMLKRRLVKSSVDEKKYLIDQNVKISLSKNEIPDIVTVVDNYTYLISATDGNTYCVRIIYQTVITTGQNSVIGSFIKDYAGNKMKRILIIKDFNPKVETFVTRRKTQLFEEEFFMHDALQHKDQPKWEPLTKNEMARVKEEYNLTVYSTPKLRETDPMTRYFDLDTEDIIRIIRPHPISAESVTYKMVKN